MRREKKKFQKIHKIFISFHLKKKKQRKSMINLEKKKSLIIIFYYDMKFSLFFF